MVPVSASTPPPPSSPAHPCFSVLVSLTLVQPPGCSHPANLAHFLSSVLECASPIHPHSLNPSPPLVFNQTLPFLRSSLCLPYFKRHPISAVLCLPVLRYFIFIALFFTHRIIELLICLLYVSSLRR